MEYGITGYFGPTDVEIKRKRYSIEGDSRGAAVLKPFIEVKPVIEVPQNSPSSKQSSLEYREYEAESEEEAIEIAREEGLIRPTMLEIIFGKSKPCMLGNLDFDKGIHPPIAPQDLMRRIVERINNGEPGTIFINKRRNN